MKKMFIIIGAVFLTAAVFANDKYFCIKAVEPVKIDGKLEEASWKSAPYVPYFKDMFTGGDTFLSTKAKMLWDDKYLYIAYEFDDPNIWFKETIRDIPMCYANIGYISGVKTGLKESGWNGYDENFSKLYIDPDKDGKNYIEMHVNPVNKICDKWQGAPWSKSARAASGILAGALPEPHVEWNCPGLETAVTVNGTLNDPFDIDKGWTIEIAIPLSSIKEACGNRVSYPPREGDSWRILLGRRHSSLPKTAEASYWTWPVLFEKDCHNPHKWGEVIFKEKKDPAVPLEPVSGNKTTLIYKPPETSGAAGLPKAKFDWKALCVWLPKDIKPEAIKQTVQFSKETGFNVIIPGAAGKTLQDIISEAKKADIKVLAWLTYCYDPKGKMGGQDLQQVIRPYESGQIGKPRNAPDRDNIYGKNWLCPDRGLSRYEIKMTEDTVKNYEVDGILIDFLGYKNYYACFCAYSNKEREEFAGKNPQLTEKEVLTQFSENSLINYIKQIRKIVNGIKPGLKLAIHIYPDFDLDPVYGAKLDVDYCAQTVAWFYEPFWSYGKIKQKLRLYSSEEGKYIKNNTFVPFLGVKQGNDLKTPERLRDEIRLIGASGSKNIMLAFYHSLVEVPGFAEVVKEELR